MPSRLCCRPARCRFGRPPGPNRSRERHTLRPCGEGLSWLLTLAYSLRQKIREGGPPRRFKIAQHRQPALRALPIAHRPRSGATRIRRPHLRTIARPLSITATPSTQAGGTPPPRRCIASVISRRTGRETYGNESRMVSNVNYRDIMRPIGNGLPERAETIGWCGFRAGSAPSY
jgi:hypothetical protein